MKNLRFASPIFCSVFVACALAVGAFVSTSAGAQTTFTANVNSSFAAEIGADPMAAVIYEIDSEISGLRLSSWVARNQPRMTHVAECWQRQGPYATQDTAWRRWREARDEGYQVSNGIYRCDWDGYCFTVYFPC